MSASTASPQPLVTVGIKALNEEAKIARCIESALAAVAPLDGEVILADSVSTDRTVEIARAYPIGIVQMADRADRSCGAGAQLAFQHARGRYFYILDGDMELAPGFLEAGIACMEADPSLAGIGGYVAETQVTSEEFEIRAAQLALDSHRRVGSVGWLDCGGLYRTSAIAELGWFADLNLHSFEEFELGARLRSGGWRLARIADRSADHHGHSASGYALLWRRLRSGYADGPGEVLRAAIGRPQLALVLRGLGHIRLSIVVIGWWLALAVALLLRPLMLLPLLIAPLVLLSVRRRSLRLGLYSLFAWNVTALGFLRGLAKARKPAGQPIAAHRLKGLESPN